jgi:hypothetical protein
VDHFYSAVEHRLRGALWPSFAPALIQVPLEVGGETFYIDLLFYHLRLHCYFVIELKSGKFKPEWAGYGKPDVMKSAA